MPLELDVRIVKWLKEFNLIQGEVPTGDLCELSYNDQIYFQNGYSIGQLLKHILKSKGFRSEALMRIRKIAHISSNENWQIIKEIMQDIHFEEEIDIHAITLHQIRNILQFLYETFSAKVRNVPNKKQKRTYIDPATFSVAKPIEQSYNLLQFFILAVSKVFGVPLQECLGLLIDNCKYLKKAIIQGTNNNGFETLIQFFKLVAQNMPLVNRLIAEQNESENSFLSTLGLGVLSDNSQVCEIVCIVIDNLQSNTWIEKQGCNLLLRSSNDKVLDLLLRKINPNFNLIFNEDLSSKFNNKFTELTNYGKLLKYLFKSIYGRQVFELLPLSYYLKQAFQIFEPDNVKKQPKKVKLAAKNLMKVIVCNFWGKIQYQQKNRICFSFNPQLCQSQEQRLSTLCILFEVVSELSLRQVQFVKKFYRIINQFYSKGTVDIRAFILNNLMFLYKHHPQHFPIGFFLQTYHIVNPVQACDFELINLISTNKTLLPEEAIMLLKICTIYYYQQLQAACFIEPINNILKTYTPVEWSTQLSQEILTKWPTLPIPPFQMVPPNTNKIKFRSIGLKKKQMLQFTELNRYKSILKLLTTVKNRDFLLMYGRLIASTILKVEKSKIKQMQNTRVFLNTLLAKVDSKKYQLKEQKIKQSVRSKSQALRPSQVSDQLETDPFLEEYDRDDVELNTPINILKGEQNQFMDQPINQLQVSPLLPFTDDVLTDANQKRYSEDSLFQNYELVYIKNIMSKYESLLKFIAEKYQHSANVQHFLANLNILSYFQKDIPTLKTCQERLRLSQDSSSSISSKLVLQMAFLLFQFKKSRRITIKCVESFYQLLSDKNNYSNTPPPTPTQQTNQISLNAKIDFKYQITNKNIQCNKSAEKYVVCFEVVSQILKKAIGINAVQPISCIISQILPSSNNGSQIILLKNMEKSRVSEMELKQYEQLQKLIDNQEKVEARSKYSTPIRASKNITTVVPNKEMKVKPSQKWAQVQKKVIMRRKQLQGHKTINES